MNRETQDRERADGKNKAASDEAAERENVDDSWKRSIPSGEPIGNDGLPRSRRGILVEQSLRFGKTMTEKEADALALERKRKDALRQNDGTTEGVLVGLLLLLLGVGSAIAFAALFFRHKF